LKVSEKKKLGEILLELGVISEEELRIALKEQSRTGEKLGEVITRLGFATEEEIHMAIAQQAGTRFVDLRDIIINPDALTLVPEHVAKEFKLVPIKIDDNTITIVISNPFNFKAIDTIREITGREVIVYTSKEEDIVKALENVYGFAVSIEEEIENNIKEALRTVTPGAESQPVASLVNNFVLKALQLDATDIHVEPSEKVTRIRYRIDGVLHNIFTLPKRLHPSLVTRIKIISKLDIGEQRIPQDGSFSLPFGIKMINIRVSTYPTPHGESVVLRILERINILLGLEKLGFSEENLQILRRIIRKPYGIIVACGPTGSGKTTTLYSILMELNSLERNIMTIEDPIEYRLPLIKQAQINERADFTFSKALRSILRHDPDIIMVGEMRDKDTATLAFQAALTGHLVLTTLHANNAAQAIPRLRNLGVDPYLISVGLIGVIAQRLVRKVCDSCKRERTITEEDIARLMLPEELIGVRTYDGKGCEKCFHTGYRGRTGIFEILEITPAVQDLILKEAPPGVIEKAAGYKSMFQDGIEKVKAGITTPEEVIRVTG